MPTVSNSPRDWALFSLAKMQTNKIGCPEEIAFRKGYIDYKDLKNLIDCMPECTYKNYLSDFANTIVPSNSVFSDNIDKLQP